MMYTRMSLRVEPYHDKNLGKPNARCFRVVGFEAHRIRPRWASVFRDYDFESLSASISSNIRIAV